jgi:hypothetical protein
VLGRLRLRDLLDLPALGQGEGARTATGVLRIQRVEPVGVEVVDDIFLLDRDCALAFNYADSQMQS